MSSVPSHIHWREGTAVVGRTPLRNGRGRPACDPSSAASAGQFHRDGTRRELRARAVLGPDVKIGEALPAVVADRGDDAPGGHLHALGVRSAELALEADDRAAVAQPVAHEVVQVSPLQIAHAERSRVARGPARLVIHVDRHELVVDGGVAVPVVKPGDPGERRQFIAHRDVLRLCHIGCPSLATLNALARRGGYSAAWYHCSTGGLSVTSIASVGSRRPSAPAWPRAPLAAATSAESIS